MSTACEREPRRPIDPPSAEPVVVPPLDEAGRIIVRVQDGRLVDLPARRIEVESGPRELLFHHLAHPTLGGGPSAALWLRGRGAAVEWSPQYASPSLKPDSFEVWPVNLPAGQYTLSVTQGRKDVHAALVVVR